MKLIQNNYPQKHHAAVCKVIENHPDINMEPLFQWKLKFLPLIVNWFQEARIHQDVESAEVFQCRELSAVYKFVRGLPLLTVDCYRNQKVLDIQPKSKKRKFDQHME